MHLRPRKSIGQHFLRDDNIARKIVAAVNPLPDDLLLEIGPGEGALTRHLAGRVHRLVAVDLDPRVVTRMAAAFAGPGVEVVEGDILETDLGAWAAAGALRVVGNIPYNITTPILFHLLDHRGSVSDATLMMQREVARRLVAGPGGKEYGILSVVFQLHADMRLLFDVRPGAFTPRPAVTSTVVRLVMRRKPRHAVADEAHFRRVVRAAFGQRRKMLRNALAPLLAELGGGPPAGWDLGRRAEQLSVAELAMLANDLLPRRDP